MTNQLKMMVGVAVFATLALAGTLGAFLFSAAQPVDASGHSATRSFSPTTVAPEGNVTVTIALQNIGQAGGLTETIPSGFTYLSTTHPSDQVRVTGQTVRFTIFGESSVSYVVRADATAADGQYGFTGTVSDFDRHSLTVIGATMVTVDAAATGGNGGNGGGGMMPTTYDYSVTARPEDPGAATQISIKFDNPSFLAIDGSITFEVQDDLQVPSTIAANTVSIAGTGAETASDNGSPQVAAPSSVIVEYNAPDERHEITLTIADMSTGSGDAEATDDGLAAGSVTVTFRQSAGIMNRTEGSSFEGNRGADDWWVYTSEAPDPVRIHDEGPVYDVPFLLELSSYADSRGEDITVTGKGFKNSTTVRFWRDEDKDGVVDLAEVTLCSATASSADIAECSFTLSNPPFVGGTDGNYINAIDGRDQKATQNDDYMLPVVELEPSMSVNPTAGSPGDNVNVQLYDFTNGDMVSKIDFGRSFPVCDSTDDPDNTRDCDASPFNFGVVGDDGGLSFSFEIPNGITPGIQQMRVFAGPASDPEARDVDDNFTVGLGQLQVSSADVLPNQRISITGSGFTTSRGQSSAYIGRAGDIPADNACPENTSGNIAYGGEVLLGGTQIAWERVNDGDPIEVTSGGTWAGSLDLPINSLTTAASTRELKIIDCRAGVATVDLTFPEREVTMSPERGRVGSEVIITGKNFPAFNDDGSDVEITVEYDAGDGEMDDDDVEPDGLGSFTVILEVPEDAGIPSNNTVTVQFMDDSDATVTEARTHRAPQGTVDFGAASGAEGSLLTITAEGFARYTSVDEVMFGDRDITPSPKPSTNTTGDVEFDVRIPGSDPGIYIIKVEVADVSATQTFTVVSGSGVVDGSVESILANVMSEDALDRVFKFNNETKEWQWHINDPAFSSTNNLGGLSSGDLVWIKVSKSVTADILGTSVTLSCINEGMENEDCWNQISIP